ncbi:MAG: T9SS type A sorting domain-containing protein [Bacteroidales bacterium]|jgi:hypothetical protein|nr:T9SS type A sorting domain-containing protein [Bacteroidales bacterium]
MRNLAKTAILVFCFLWLFAEVSAQVNQIALSRVEQMPNLPPNYLMRNWKQVAIDYDNFIFDVTKTGTSLPLVLKRTNPGTNYPSISNFYIDTYVGWNGHLNGAEGINAIPAVVSASLNGVDKTNHFSTNWVVKLKDFFNKSNGQNVYLNNFSAGTGGDWWYEVMPNVFFYQLRSLYPNADVDFDEQFLTIANRENWVVNKLGGNVENWSIPNFAYRAFNLLTGQPTGSSWTEPETAGSIAWLLYQAYTATDSVKFRYGAELALGYLQNLTSTNPTYELQMPYGTVTAAKMNALEGTTFNIDKFLNWNFCGYASNKVRNWGTIVGNWNGYEMSGLIGEANDGGNDYAFIMNGFQHAAAFAPVAKYDKRYARALAKWLLNLASASRFFYRDYLPQANQESASYAWSQQYDPQACIPYESIKQIWQGTSPKAMGDAVGGEWATTNLSLYSGSSVGYMAAVIDTTDVQGILKIDLNKTDFSSKIPNDEIIYQTFMLYNPYGVTRNVTINLPTGNFDVYEAITETKIQTNVSSSFVLPIPSNEVRIVVLYPTGLNWKIKGRILSTEESGILDYHYQYNYANSLRIRALTPNEQTFSLGNSVFLKCQTENSSSIVKYDFFINDNLYHSGNDSIVNFTPTSLGNYAIYCVAHDNDDTAVSAVAHLKVIDATLQPPEILSINFAQDIPFALGANVGVTADVLGSNLNMTWTVTDGSLTNEHSPNPTWQVPNNEGAYTISLKVANNFGSDSVAVIGFVKDFGENHQYSPKLYYPFDGNTNNAANDELHGVNSGATNATGYAGGANTAFQFAHGNYIYVPNTTNLNSYFSEKLAIEFFIKPQQASFEQYVISHGSYNDRYKISILNSEKVLRWTLKTTAGVVDVDDIISLDYGVWTHVIVQYTGRAVEIYHNGKMSAYKTFNGTLLPSSQDLTFARATRAESNYFLTGVLDEIKFYDHELSPADIAEIAVATTEPREIANTRSFVVYPNPVETELFIDHSAKEIKSTPLKLEVYDINGKLVLTRYSSFFTTRITINISTLKTGMYFLKIDNQVAKFTKK